MNEKTDDEVPSCGNCFFSERQQIKEVGVLADGAVMPLVCRRYPPFIVTIPTPLGQTAIGSASPPVQEDNWCGEHEPTHGPLIEH